MISISQVFDYDKISYLINDFLKINLFFISDFYMSLIKPAPSEADPDGSPKLLTGSRVRNYLYRASTLLFSSFRCHRPFR